MVTHSVPIGHPDFGRAFSCPVCRGGPDVQQRQRANLRRYFGEIWMYDSAKLYQHTLEEFVYLPTRLLDGKSAVVFAAQCWVRGELLTPDMVGLESPTVAAFEPSPSLVISGYSGQGKTCLASAAFTARLGDDGVGLPIEYNALMRAIMGQIEQPGGNVDQAVMVAANAPVLFLDDLGNTFVERETPGRTRWLFEIVNHRYNQRLPMLITTNLSFEAMAVQFGDKIAERLRECAVWLEMAGPSLRLRERPG